MSLLSMITGTQGGPLTNAVKPPSMDSKNGVGESAMSNPVTNLAAKPEAKPAEGGVEQLAGEIADALMDKLFSEKNPYGQGGASFKSEDKDALGALADMVDKLGGEKLGGEKLGGEKLGGDKIQSPHDASGTGAVKNWKDEIGEDNYLNKQEKNDFRDGIAEVLTKILGALFEGLLGTDKGKGEKEVDASDPMGLKDTAAGMSSSPMGSAGQTGKDITQTAISELSKQKMDNIIPDAGSDMTVPKDNREIGGKVGSFMDQSPEKFGKPSVGGSWAQALGGGSELSSKDISKVKEGVEMGKDALDGKSQDSLEMTLDSRLLAGSVMAGVANDLVTSLSDKK